MSFFKNNGLFYIWTEPTSDCGPYEIMSSFKAYYDSLVYIDTLPTPKEKFAACQKLVNTISSEYHPTLFNSWVYDLALELAIEMDFWKESPPYNSIKISKYYDRGANMAKAKLLNLYREARTRLAQYSSMLEITTIDNALDDKHKNNNRNIIIIEHNMGRLLKYPNDKVRRECNSEQNNQLREYTKMAKNFLEIKSTQEKVNSLKGLLELIEHECKLFLSKDSLVEWTYKMTDKASGVSREITGPPDFEAYLLAFNNTEERRKISTLLDCPDFKDQDILFAELEIFVLHTAIKVELRRAEKELECQLRTNNRKLHPGDPVHFSKRVSNEELTAIYNGLMEHEMLCNNSTLADFIYWHTGQGSKPTESLMWKTKNVCRYYVFRYLDSDWTTAELCFSCKRGSISNLISASNITKDNMEIINEILKKARQ